MRIVLIMSCVLSTPAFASWPGDLSVERMAQHQGQPVEPDVALHGFEQITRGLAATIANKPVAPARTLGAAGVDVSFGLTTLLRDRSAPSTGAPNGWDLARLEGSANPFLAVPTLSVRKGLPGSVELGAAAGWIAGTPQGTFSGFVRAAPLEGNDEGPDLALQLGYATFVGHPELSLGTFDLSGTIGGTIPFASSDEIASGTFSPFIGGGVLLMHGKARVDSATQAAVLGASTLDDPTRIPLTPIPQIQGGLQITNHTALVRLSGTYAFGVGPSLHAGMGFMY